MFLKHKKDVSTAERGGEEDISGGAPVGTPGGDGDWGLTGQILGLALPALVSLCVDPLMSAVDTAYIGRLGADLGGGEVIGRPGCLVFFSLLLLARLMLLTGWQIYNAY